MEIFNSDDENVKKFEQMGRDNITKLVPTKSDAELAQEFKEKVAQVYEPLLALLNEYDKHGLNMQAGVGKNAFGKYQITQLQVVKVF